MARRTLSTSRSWLFAVASLVIAAGAGLATYWMQPGAPVSMIPAVASTAPSTRPATIALIASEARQLKLITWTFETTLDAQSISDKWYGDSIAQVRAPVRCQYGVDLQTLEDGSIYRDSASGAVTFVVKPPQRLSAEIDVEQLQQSLKTTGLRSRSGNQTQLDATLKELGAVAKHLTLSPRDEQRMREVSRNQIEQHLQRVLARLDPLIVVNVKFAE